MFYHAFPPAHQLLPVVLVPSFPIPRFHPQIHFPIHSLLPFLCFLGCFLHLWLDYHRLFSLYHGHLHFHCHLSSHHHQTHFCPHSADHHYYSPQRDDSPRQCPPHSPLLHLNRMKARQEPTKASRKLRTIRRTPPNHSAIFSFASSEQNPLF